MNESWTTLSFMDNFATGLELLGTRGAGVAWGLASIQWDSQIERDQALASLAAKTGDDGRTD